MYSQNVFVKISNHYSELTQAQRLVADFILTHQNEVQFLSISDLADQCKVADGTVSRFCRDMGYTGFSSFKIAVAKCLTRMDDLNTSKKLPMTDQSSFSRLINNIYQENVDALTHTTQMMTEETVTKACTLMEQADRIFLMGQGGSLTVAMEMQTLMMTISNKFICVQDSATQIATASLLEEKDVLILFSYSGSTREMLELASVAHKRRARLILITHYPKSPLEKYVDVILLCGTNENPLNQGSVPARMAQLLVVDVLFHSLYSIDKKRAEQNREWVSNAIGSRHL